MNVKVRSAPADQIDTFSEDMSDPEHTWKIQQKLREAVLDGSNAEAHMVIVHWAWWYEAPIQTLTYEPPVFTDLFSALNDDDGKSHMLTDVTHSISQNSVMLMKFFHCIQMRNFILYINDFCLHRCNMLLTTLIFVAPDDFLCSIWYAMGG